MEAWSEAAGRCLRCGAAAPERGTYAQRRRVGDLAIFTLNPTPDMRRFGVIRFEPAPEPLPSLERLMREGMLDASEATRVTEAIADGTDVLVVGPIDSARHRLIEALIRYLPDDSLIVMDDLAGVVAIDPERRVVPAQIEADPIGGEYLPRLVHVADGPTDALRAIEAKRSRPGSPQLILGYPARSATAAYQRLQRDGGGDDSTPRLALELRETGDGGLIDASLIEIAAPVAPSSL
jgi:hypothetical protein